MIQLVTERLRPEWDGPFAVMLAQRPLGPQRRFATVGFERVSLSRPGTSFGSLGLTVQQRDLENNRHVFCQDPKELSAQRLRNISQVFFVAFGDDDRLNPGPNFRQRFLFQAADW